MKTRTEPIHIYDAENDTTWTIPHRRTNTVMAEVSERWVANFIVTEAVCRNEKLAIYRTSKGAKNAPRFFIPSCKNAKNQGIDPRGYLIDVLTQLPQIGSAPEDIRALEPRFWKQNQHVQGVL